MSNYTLHITPDRCNTQVMYVVTLFDPEECISVTGTYLDIDEGVECLKLELNNKLHQIHIKQCEIREYYRAHDDY